MNKINLICLFISLTLLNSCGSFTKLDERVDNYVNEIEINSKNMTENDWREADLTMEQLKIELDEQKQDLTPEQILKANKAIGRYAGLRIKDGMLDLKDQLKDFGEQLQGVVKELVDTLDN